jgi:hypothetical protein
MVRVLVITIDVTPSIMGTPYKGTTNLKKVMWFNVKDGLTFINYKLRLPYHNDFSKKVVMEKLLGSNMVKSHFLVFYLP